MPKSAILIAERQVICPTPVTANFIMDLITALLGTYYNVHYLNKMPLSTTSIVRFLSMSKIALKHCITVPVIVTNLSLFSTFVHLHAVPFVVIQRLSVFAIPKRKLGLDTELSGIIPVDISKDMNIIIKVSGLTRKCLFIKLENGNFVAELNIVMV